MQHAAELDAEAVARLLDGAGEASFLVVGDVMLDEYLVGVVERTSPEAPVPVLRVQEQRSNLGGAANVARQLAAFGARVRLVGRVGEDDAGAALIAACGEAGIDPQHVVVSGPAPTTRKQRVVAGRQQLVRIDVEEVDHVAGPDAEALVGRLAAGPRPDAVVISDYAKGFVSTDLLAALMAQARRWGVPVLVDPKFPDLGRYRGATVVKANQVEFEAAIGRPLGGAPLDGLEAEGQRVRAEAGLEHLVVTLGERGLVVIDDERPTSVPSRSSDEVFDVSGAGDTVLALLALGLVGGLPLHLAAVAANAAAGVVVRRAGVAVATPDDVRRTVPAGPAPDRPEVSLPSDEVAEAVRGWKALGRRVVFTNGCFDLLHAGHVHLLREAAALGDALVVGINDDDSVRALKGPDRPVVPQADRAALVAAIRGVDAVIVFGGPDPGPLIDRLVPDVLVKGGDYALDEIVGRDTVEQAGGQVITVPLLPGASTTSTIDRLRRAEEPA